MDVPILLSHTPGRYQTQYFWSPMSPGKNQPCFMMGLTVSQMVRQTKSRPHRFAGAGRGANAWGSAPRHRTGRDRRESPAPQPPSPAPHSHRAKAAILGQSVLRRHEAFRECHVQRINIRSNIPSNTSKGVSTLCRLVKCKHAACAASNQTRCPTSCLRKRRPTHRRTAPCKNQRAIHQQHEPRNADGLLSSLPSKRRRMA